MSEVMQLIGWCVTVLAVVFGLLATFGIVRLKLSVTETDEEE